ncbi:IS200/IS605 family transposase [Flaviaesturariibacter terrae]
MANTFLQIHVHIVMAVKYRASLILPSYKDRLHQYLIGIFHNHGHRVLAINSMPDHIHILFGYDPKEPLPTLMQQVKRDSSLWINQQGFLGQRFAWQEGYGAFAVCKRHLDVVIRYIANQEQHHLGKNLVDEYGTILDAEGLDYLPERIFHLPLE